MNRRILTTLFALTLFPGVVFGWHSAGHQTVAAIAYDRLNSDVKAKVDEWINVATVSFPKHQGFIGSATLFDDFKNQGIRAFDSWHYAIVPYDPTGYLTAKQRERISRSLDGKDAIFAIGEAVHTLKDKDATPYAKGFMLTLLIHTVADIHQPMHVSSLYSEKFPRGDRGGNNFTLIYNGKSTSLHSFFDDIAGLGKELHNPLTKEESEFLSSLKESITKEYPESDETATTLLDPKQWKMESNEFAIEARKNLCVNQTLTPEYVEWAQKKSKERVALAGYRLANLLNQIVK